MRQEALKAEVKKLGASLRLPVPVPVTDTKPKDAPSAEEVKKEEEEAVASKDEPPKTTAMDVEAAPQPEGVCHTREASLFRTLFIQ